MLAYAAASRNIPEELERFSERYTPEPSQAIFGDNSSDIIFAQHHISTSITIKGDVTHGLPCINDNRCHRHTKRSPSRSDGSEYLLGVLKITRAVQGASVLD